MGRESRPGVVFRVGDGLHFIPASVALRVAAIPRITAVPGAPSELLGIGLEGGVIMGIFAVGDARTEMIICQYAGELFGIVGGHVVKTGAFELSERAAEVVIVGDEYARPFDVGAMVARLHGGTRTTA